MKHASYHAGVSWIARSVTLPPVTTDLLLHPLDALDIRSGPAVALLAELFGVSADRVAGDVLREKRSQK